MFRWDVVWQNLFSPWFLTAALTTLWIAVVAQACRCIIGLFLALMRISRYPVLSWIARFYIWIFRGSPLLVQILILFFGIPEIFPALPPFISVYTAALV